MCMIVSPEAPAASQPAKATTTRQLLQTGSDCGFICNYLPLRCRCRQQLLFRMGTAESESSEGYHTVPPAVARKPICHRSHLRLCRLQLLLGLWLQLWPSHLTRPRVWLVAAHALIIAGQLRSTWSHGRMVKWPNGTTIERTGAGARRLRLHQGQYMSCKGREGVRSRGVSVRIPSKAPHWAHKFSHRARRKDEEWNSSYASI